MCLSKVYDNSAAENNVLLTNVQRIDFDGDDLVFTDLLENETRIQGRILKADLVNGKIIIETKN